MKKKQIYLGTKPVYLGLSILELSKILIPPCMRRRSDVSFRSHIDQDVADHAETSS